MDEKMIAATMHCGVAPLSVDYHALVNVKTRKVQAFRSTLLVNSLDLGVLSPEQYRFVANRSQQAQRLAVWNLKSTAAAAKKLADGKCEYEWVSLCVPCKMAMKDDFPDVVLRACDKAGEGAAEKMCVEFLSDVLFDDTEKLGRHMKVLKDHGIKSMLSEYGGDFCPTLRLSGMNFDYVVLDAVLTDNEEHAEQLISVSHMVKSRGSEIVYENIEGDDDFSRAYRNSAEFCFLRKETEEDRLFQQLMQKGGETEE